MAGKNIKNIDEVYKEETGEVGLSSARKRRLLKKKGLGDDFTDGAGFSTAGEQTEFSSEEEEEEEGAESDEPSETESIPPSTPFECKYL